MRATVLGAGSWGTALASVLASKGFPVAIWDKDRPTVETLNQKHENVRYLPGAPLPPSLHGVVDLGRALEGADLVVIAVPSHAVRPVAIEAKHHLHAGAPIVSAAKGVEQVTSMTMSEVLEDVLPVSMHPYLTFLGGPSFAQEVVRGLPTAVTIAGRWERVTKQVQDAFHTPTFRPYTSTDIIGCEIGGCVKNVIAIASGLATGMGFGENARAALLTRGLAEITRLAVKKGANPLTLSGLAGLGDLILTASSELSRNFRVGLFLGQGKSLEQIQVELGQVAEGVGNAKSVRELAAKMQIEMPISDMVYRVLYEGHSPRQGVNDLMTREKKSEL